MPITITIDKSPDGELEMDLEARDTPDPAHLQIATMLFAELHQHLSPGCFASRPGRDPIEH